MNSASSLVPQRRRRDLRRNWLGWVFTAPFGLAFLAFLIAPLAYAFWMSLQVKTLLSGTHFAGLENYVRAATDPLFLSGIWLVVRFALVLIPVQMVISLAAALLLDGVATRLARVSRLLLFVPYAVPAVIGAIMWGFLYSKDFGPFQAVFHAIGLAAPNPLDASNVFAALVNIVVWQWAGYYMIILFSALQGIDPTLYESARIDGANAWQIALRIKLPLIRSALVVVLVFALIGTLQFFTEPQILRSIAGGAISPSYTPNMYAYTVSFGYGQFNYASAISFALGVVVFVASALFMRLSNRREGRA